MTTVKKQSMLIQQALRWISEQRLRDPRARPAALLSEAGARFNLSPAEQEQLLAMLTAGSDGAGNSETT
ncbi:MAG: hypothetical protein DRI34_02435 [Deltaproteobacteria bacterium]|nr:MAG: hypothetical protein DRI34_02435 [Deltaproteobacteria bacterium]